MKILFNLANYSGTFSMISKNDIGVAQAVLTRVCMDNGMPLQPAYYDRNQSFNHLAIYEHVRAYAEELLFCVPTPDMATLTSLGNLQFQLTMYNRN